MASGKEILTKSVKWRIAEVYKQCRRYGSETPLDRCIAERFGVVDQCTIARFRKTLGVAPNADEGLET